MAGKRILCPQCKCDVAVVGFTTHAIQTQTWMQICGGLARIATTVASSDEAHCNCGALLPMKAVDLLRVA